MKETEDSKVLHEFNYDPAGHVYFRRSEPFATESWAYYYNNSDGTMVAKTGVGGGTTVYVGGVYEKNISGPTSEISYYYANGNRVAMRKDGALSFFAQDHLGGTSLVMNASGQMVNRIRYFPFGNMRTEEYFEGQSAPPETDKLFTGQQRETPSGIYYYGVKVSTNSRSK